MHYGVWPVDLIDHRNGIRDDNRISNLRACSNGQNKIAARIGRNNTSGAKGVSLCTFASGNQKWKAMLSNKSLGYFATYDEAVAARLRAEKEVW